MFHNLSTFCIVLRLAGFCRVSLDKWRIYANTQDAKLTSCDGLIKLNATITRLNLDKHSADSSTDSFLSPSMNSGGEPSKMNILRAEESRRRSAQIQEQILGLIATISR